MEMIQISCTTICAEDSVRKESDAPLKISVERAETAAWVGVSDSDEIIVNSAGR